MLAQKETLVTESESLDRTPAKDVLDLADLGREVRVAGRVRSVRRMRATTFFDVSDISGTIQCALPTPIAEDERLKPGVLVDLQGVLDRTRTGALVIMASEPSDVLTIGAAAMTQELKAERLHRTGRSVRDQRAQEILVDAALQRRLVERAKTLHRLRGVMYDNEFLEVDTPVLALDRFAGSAESFAVTSKSLARTLYLRGSLENHLKQLVVGGMERVFNVGPSFRNESEALIEFLMLEGAMAYASQMEAMTMIEHLTRVLAEEFEATAADPDAREALMLPWRVVDFHDLLSTHLNFDTRTVTLADVRNAAARHELDLTVPDGDPADAMANLGYTLLKWHIADELKEPTFVNHFPTRLSPLARACSTRPDVADRGYMFFRGHRMCEIVQEENDVIRQRSNFERQDEGRNDPTTSTSHVNEVLLDALALGCPPTAGFGFHINRFVAAVSGQDRVSDVVPFPLTSARIAR